LEHLIYQKLLKGEPIKAKAGKDKIEETITFKVFSETWFSNYVLPNNKHSEVDNKKIILRKHLLPVFGGMKLPDINARSIEEYKAKKKKEKLSDKTINNTLIVLNKALHTAMDWEYLKSIPKIKLLKVPQQSFDFITEAEYQCLIDGASGVLKFMVTVAIRTGMRFGELQALDWTNINMSSRKITVKQAFSRDKLGGTKNYRIRYVPFGNELYQLFSSKQRTDGFVFANDDGGLFRRGTYGRALRKLCQKVGLRRIGWHVLRHSLASMLAQKGASLLQIKELLGHADIKTTLKYAHLGELGTTEAIALLEKPGIEIVRHRQGTAMPERENQRALVSV